MSKEKLYIFDTTLRDGAQTQGVDFSIDDKEKISNSLDNLGLIILKVVGQELTQLILNFLIKIMVLKMQNLTAFGMTKKSEHSAENDPMLSIIN